MNSLLADNVIVHKSLFDQSVHTDMYVGSQIMQDMA